MKTKPNPFVFLNHLVLKLKKKVAVVVVAGYEL